CTALQNFYFRVVDFGIDNCTSLLVHSRRLNNSQSPSQPSLCSEDTAQSDEQAPVELGPESGTGTASGKTTDVIMVDEHHAQTAQGTARLISSDQSKMLS